MEVTYFCVGGEADKQEVIRVMRVMRVMQDTAARYCQSLISPKRVTLLMVSRTVDGILSATRVPRV